MAQIQFKEPTIHPEGSFQAHVTAIEQLDMQYGPTLKVYLTTNEGVLECLCSLFYTPKSKLTGLARAAFGQIPENLDTDDLLGKQVGVIVETVDKDGVEYSKVASFHRLKKSGKKSDDPFEDS